MLTLCFKEIDRRDREHLYSKENDLEMTGKMYVFQYILLIQSLSFLTFYSWSQ